MSQPTWLELLREQLVNFDEPISDGKYLALRDGGGITLDRRDSTIKLTGAACRNLDILGIVMLMHKEKQRRTTIEPFNGKYYYPANEVLVRLHCRKGDDLFVLCLKDCNDYPSVVASVADFYGIPHNVGLEYKRKGWSYEDTRQRIRAHFKEKYGGFEPDRPLPKPAPPDWKKIGCLSLCAGVAICIPILMNQCSKQQQKQEQMTKAINQKSLAHTAETNEKLIENSFKAGELRAKNPIAQAAWLLKIKDEKVFNRVTELINSAPKNRQGNPTVLTYMSAITEAEKSDYGQSLRYQMIHQIAAWRDEIKPSDATEDPRIENENVVNGSQPRVKAAIEEILTQQDVLGNKDLPPQR